MSRGIDGSVKPAILTVAMSRLPSPRCQPPPSAGPITMSIPPATGPPVAVPRPSSPRFPLRVSTSSASPTTTGSTSPRSRHAGGRRQPDARRRRGDHAARGPRPRPRAPVAGRAGRRPWGHGRRDPRPGRIAIVAHPLLSMPGSASRSVLETLAQGRPDRRPDAIESFNWRVAWLPGYRRRVEKLAADAGYAVVGGSDAHRPADAGRGVTRYRGRPSRTWRLRSRMAKPPSREGRAGSGGSSSARDTRQRPEGWVDHRGERSPKRGSPPAGRGRPAGTCLPRRSHGGRGRRSGRRYSYVTVSVPRASR